MRRVIDSERNATGVLAEALILLVLHMRDYSSAVSGPSKTSSFNLQRRNGRRYAQAMPASTVPLGHSVP